MKNTTHEHHIIPKHEWKERFGDLRGVDAQDNLITLTLEQHAEAHKLLYELFCRWEDNVASQLLYGQITMSEATRLVMMEGRRMGGRISGSLRKGRKPSEESNRKRSMTLKGNPNVFVSHEPKTEAHKKKISESMLAYRKEKEAGCVAEVSFSRGKG